MEMSGQLHDPAALLLGSRR